MTKIRKPLSLLLCLFVIMSSLVFAPALTAGAAEVDLAAAGSVIDSGNDGTFAWSIDSDYTITLRNSNAGTRRSWYQHETKIRRAIVEEGITEIPKNYFDICTKLADVQLPSTLQAIRLGAFKSTRSLTTITIPDSVYYIHREAFKRSGVTKFNISSSNPYLCAIDGNVYSKDKTELLIYAPGKTAAHFTVPDFVTRIGEGAFVQHDYLTSVRIPGSVDVICDSAFKDIPNLTKVVLGDGVRIIGIQAFCFDDKLNSINIPGSVELIKADAFRGCGLFDVVLEEGVKEIQIDAFKANNLSRVVVPRSITKLSDNAVPATDIYAYSGTEGASYVSRKANMDKTKNLYLLNNYDNLTYRDASTDVTLKSRASFTLSTQKYTDAATKNTYKAKIGNKPVSAVYAVKIKYSAMENGDLYAPATIKLPSSSKADLYYIDDDGYGTKLKSSYSNGYVTATYSKYADTNEYRYFVLSGSSSSSGGSSSGGSTSSGGSSSSGSSSSTPAAPTLKAPVISSASNTQNGVKLSWNTVSGAQKYRVYLRSGSSWTKLTDVASPSYTYTAAKSGATYTFAVKALSGSVYSALSATKSIKYLAAPKITKIENTASGAKITWGKVTGADKYRVYLKSGSSWKKLGDTASNTFTYQKATSGKSYTYTVACLAKDGSGIVSAYNKSGTTSKYVAAPTLGKASVLSGGLKITWSKVTGAERYRVFLKTSSGWQKLGDTTANSYTYKKVKTGSSYTFTVRCVSKDGKKAVGPYCTSKLYQYLAAPKITKIQNTYTGAKLTWGKVKGAAKYRVYVKSGSSWKKLGDTASNTFIYKKAASGTKYTYTVACLSKDGSSLASTYSATGKSGTYLAAPKITKFENTASGIKITWGKVKGAVKYRLYVKSGSSWKALKDTAAASYTHTGLKTNTTYTYAVRAFTKDGKSVSAYRPQGWSKKFMATPQITGFKDTAKGTVITWKAVPGAKAYRVYYKNGSSWKKITDTTATSATYAQSASGKSITYTVRSVAAVGSATATSSFSATGWKHTRPNASSIKIKLSQSTLYPGDTATASVTYSPATANNKITWTSSNPSVATISASGKITAKASGSATFTAATDNGKKATYNLIVRRQVDNIYINLLTLSMAPGDKTTLTTKITPSNAYDTSVAWSSSAPAVAAVSSAGVVTAKAEGTAVVTVTSHNGKSASCTVTVKKISKAAAQIGLGYQATAILTESGELYVCGYVGSAITGTSSSYTSKPVKLLTGVKALPADGYNGYGAAILNNGDLYTWSYTQKPTKILSNVRSVSIGLSHYGAVLNNGDLYTWGKSDYYQLGTGSSYTVDTPTKILSGVQSFSAGYHHSAAVMTNGDLYTWGFNGNGECGLGESSDRYVKTPTKVSLSGVVSVSCNEVTAAILSNGDLYTWGNNGNKLAGNGSSANVYVPAKILSGVSAVSLGSLECGAVTTGGDLYTWNTYTTPHKYASGVKTLSYGNSHEAYVDNTGTIYMWGDVSHGEIGNDDYIKLTKPTKLIY